jgi:hypothetical protein
MDSLHRLVQASGGTDDGRVRLPAGTVLIAALVCSLFGTVSVLARPQAAAAQAGRGERTVRPRRIARPPTIDGRLSDDVWAEATRITRFVQIVPAEGEVASEATEVWIAYDSERIYFGFYAHYSDPTLIRANRVERDQIGQDDTITVYFDTTGDRQRAYAFSVNGYGVQGDAIVIGATAQVDASSGLPVGNDTWDALFTSAGMLVDDGWTAEMAIPFKSLRYPARGSDEAHRWGFQIARIIASKAETIVAFPVTRNISGFVPQLGVIDGITGISTSRNLEILPTFTAIGSRSLDAGSGAFSHDRTTEGALNVKYGVTSNLTADFTVNPDFSQIESDRPQIEVNQRFPLLFPELRPFFLEGQDIFNVPAPVNLLNTRTIVDPGYGAKLTGKVGKTSLGLLAASDEAPGKSVLPVEAGYGENAHVNVARIRYDAYRESYVGTLVTDRELGDSYSRMAGADGQFRLTSTDRQFFILFHSWHRDLDGTELSGWAFGTNYRHSGRHLNASLFGGFTSPGFRNDVGVVKRVDTRNGWIDVSYRWWPEAQLVNWGPRLRYERNYNFAGDLDDEIIRPGLDFTFARNVRVGLGAERSLERYRDIDFWKWRYTSTFSVAASRRISVSGDLAWGDQIRYVANPFLGEGTTMILAANVRPFSRLQMQVDANLSRLVDPRSNRQVFDVRVMRALTTYQFTDRLLVRNIMEYNTSTRAVAANLLLTYRVNSGTVFFVGYDGHYQQGDLIDARRYPSGAFQQTNRAFFTKFSYLFRYGS